MKTSKNFGQISYPNCGETVNFTMNVENKNQQKNNASQSISQSAPQSAAEAIEVLLDKLKGNDELYKMAVVIGSKIKKSGYVETSIVRRWIPSQMLGMLELVRQGRSLDQQIRDRGIEYQFKVMINEFKHILHAQKHGDFEDANDRLRWYNDALVVNVIEEIHRELDSVLNKNSKYLAYSKRAKTQYVNIGFKGVNNGRFLKIGEMMHIVNFFNVHTLKISLSMKSGKNKTEFIIEYLSSVLETIKNIRKYRVSVSKSFISAYKAAGGYYTSKDLIMYKGCVAPYAKGAEGSLILLESLANKEELAIYEGYKMVGFLRELLDANTHVFNYKKAKSEWAKQKEMRAAARKQNVRRF